MAFDGTGVFNRLYSWVQDKANSIFVNATRMDAEMNGMATGLTTCLTKDGQSTPTANIGLGGFKIINMANGSAATDAATVGQVPTLAGAAAFYDAGNSGVALSLDFANGQNQQVTLTNNATLTLGNGVTVGWHTIRIVQDVTGGRTLTWAGANYSANRWVGGSTTVKASRLSFSAVYFMFFWDGSLWYQYYLGPVQRYSRYSASAYFNGGQTFSNDSVTYNVALDTSVADTYSEFTLATGIFTAKAPGLYLVEYQGTFTNSSTAPFTTTFTLNGTGLLYGSAAPARSVVAAAAYSGNYIPYHFSNVLAMDIGSTAYLTTVCTSGSGGRTLSVASMTVTRIGDS